MDWSAMLSDPQTYISFATLAALEIVLGIDNIVFISILTGRLPEAQRAGAMRLGLGLALGARLVLLLSLAWIMRLTEPLFTVWGTSVSGKDLVLLFGGLFLLAKATHEIYVNVEHPEDHGPDPDAAKGGKSKLTSILIQIALLDIVFSLDSVITAVGMAEHVPVMAAAIIVAVIVMMVFAAPVGAFVQRHASVRILALSFLVLIGVLLIAEGTGQHFPKGYIYFSMAFALSVELLNMRLRSRRVAAAEG